MKIVAKVNYFDLIFKQTKMKHDIKLHDAIEFTLENKGVPLTFDEIAKEINSDELYSRNDFKRITGSQIRSRVSKYTKLFININGYVVSTRNRKWRNLLSAYWDLSNNLKGLYNISDLEFIVAGLFYYKRLNDLNNVKLVDSYKFIYNFNSIHINSSHFSTNDIGSKIFEDIARLLRVNSFDKVLILLKPLNEFNAGEFTDEEYGNAFEYVLEINNSENLKTRLVRTPRTVIELMSNILDPKSGKLYDPVCGTGGFLTQSYRISKKLQIFGSEINYRIAQIAYMNQMMNGDYSSNIVSENCFDQLQSPIRYDYMIGDLPMDGIDADNLIELGNFHEFVFPKRAKRFGAFLLFSVAKLSNTGKAVFTVSESFLSKSGTDEHVRNTLLKYDFIETVISLPNGALKPYTNGKVAILVINKSKNLYQSKKIKFISLPEHTLYEGIDVNQILQYYSDDFVNNSFAQIVPIEDVGELNTLNPNSYTNELVEVRRLLATGGAVRLNELIVSFSGITPFDKDDVNKENGIPLIKIENLERDILDMYLSKKSVKDYILSENPKYEKYIIKRECLLLAKIGDNIKATYFKPSGDLERIMIHSNVIALFPKTNNRVSLEFLYYQLYSDFLINQIDKKLSKSIMPFLTITAIKELIVPVLDTINQKDFIEFQKANSIANERSRIAERFNKLGYIEDAQEKELNIVRTITHQLKHHLTGLSTVIDKISAITIKNNLGNYREYDENDSRLLTLPGFEPAENNILEETIQKASKKSKFVNNILKDVEKAIIFTVQYSEIRIDLLLEEIKNDYLDKNFGIEIICDEISAEISKTHIEDLFNTLIENAEQHSFKGIKKPKITFNIKKDLNRGIIVIDYRNNGTPLSISENEFKSILTKSIKSEGTGIGGYYINKIVEAHKGSLRIADNLLSGVHFIIELPLKPQENE